MLKPITSEKAVKLIDIENTLLFETSRNSSKPEIQKEVEETFSVKVEKIRTLIKKNKKFTYVKLTKKYPAIDVATKLGMM
ncbi:MAG: 50S ribosomal protein L23 [Nanoarchaeota archaeon]